MQRAESDILEFKLRIDRQRKIARTLVAFANTSGGTLVVGVRDNGSVAGCRAEEEAYMVEGAAQRYCRPEVKLSLRAERWEHKEVLVVEVSASVVAPHAAQEEDSDEWTVYVRRGAANFRANRVLLEELKLRTGQAAEASVAHLQLLAHLNDQEGQTASRLARTTGTPIRDVEEGLAVLLHWGQIVATPREKGWVYLLPS
ncbi:MAG: helix-turn-helix domain-containing protein [Schleiferiaceae bacterium]|jgi:predicted HTH transcriptional regulator